MIDFYKKQLGRMKIARFFFDTVFILALFGSVAVNVELMGVSMAIMGVLVFAGVIGVIREFIIVKPYNLLCDKINALEGE